MPMQAQPQHQQPAMPEPLTGLPQELAPSDHPRPTRDLVSVCSATTLASEMDEALNLAMNLDTK